jgi:hypothetical protein
MPSSIISRAAVLAAAAAVGLLAGPASAQTFQRLGTCPTLGCVLPPDQSEFLPGQYFDLRVEVHAPLNGSEAFNGGVPDEKFSVTIAKDGAAAVDFASFFKVADPKLEKWTFGWYEDLFAEDAKNRTLVNVASKAYRRIALYQPGKYVVSLKYYNGTKTTTANWSVRPLAQQKKAKNIIFFIGEFAFHRGLWVQSSSDWPSQPLVRLA